MKKGNLTYEYNINPNFLSKICINKDGLKAELKGYVVNELMKSLQTSVTNPFDVTSIDVSFDIFINSVINEVLDAIKLIKLEDKNEELSARMSNYLFEGFAKYWVNVLLQEEKYLSGVRLWERILSIVNEWEINNKPIIIHKGTLYYFLAENYLLTGDRDTAFIYLYNAIEDDKILGKFAPCLNYPDKSPAYLTATMRADENNQMYYLVKQLRLRLGDYIAAFDNDFHKSFKLHDFDNNFLNNKELVNIVYFFVFNFLYLVVLRTTIKPNLLQNEFARLKTLDVIFNICLIIDEVLKKAESKAKSITLPASHKISDGILWICDSKGWMKSNDLQTFWNKNNLNVAASSPDVIIPKLLCMNELYNGNPVKREVFSLLLAHNLRNYGGHNIDQQFEMTRSYDAIIKQLLMALFLCVEAL